MPGADAGSGLGCRHNGPAGASSASCFHKRARPHGRSLMSGRKRTVFATAVLAAPVLALGVAGAGPVAAQKSGGMLVVQHWDSPASMSIHEEATYSVVV